MEDDDRQEAAQTAYARSGDPAFSAGTRAGPRVLDPRWQQPQNLDPPVGLRRARSGVSLLPALSVVMPVKNAGPYLDAAMESVLSQTFSDFEFFIRDDGSPDQSSARLRFWAERDERIRLFSESASLGPAGSSNWVVRQAEAPIVARMDADE